MITLLDFLERIDKRSNYLTTWERICASGHFNPTPITASLVKSNGLKFFWQQNDRASEWVRRDNESCHGVVTVWIEIFTVRISSLFLSRKILLLFYTEIHSYHNCIYSRLLLYIQKAKDDEQLKIWRATNKLLIRNFFIFLKREHVFRVENYD